MGDADLLGHGCFAGGVPMTIPDALPPCGEEVCDVSNLECGVTNLECALLTDDNSVQCRNSVKQCDSVAHFSTNTNNFNGGATPPPPQTTFCDVSTQSSKVFHDCATQSELISFSPALCHELIHTLTSEQLTRELEYFGLKNMRQKTCTH